MTSPTEVDETWDAGDLGRGELVLELKTRLDRMESRRLMKLVALDLSVSADLPAWCRMPGHTLVSCEHPVYLIRRKEN